MVTVNRTVRLVLPWVWTAIVAAAVVLIVSTSPDGPEGFADYAVVVSPILITALAAAIFNKSPGNRIAWLLLIAATAGPVEETANIRIDGAPDPVTLFDVLAIATRNLAFFFLLIVPLSLLLFWFPTGRPLNRRWRWSSWVSIAVYISGVMVWVFGDELTFDGAGWTVQNPIGLFPTGGPVLGIGFLVFGLGLISLLVGGVTSVIVRYRRADTMTRGQIKLVGLTMSLWAIDILMRMLLDIRGHWLAEIVNVALFLLVPTSIAVAITRYRLFDIDRLVSRTVAYVIVAALLAAVYVALVVLPGLIIGGQGDDGSSADAPPVVVAAATLAVAALFNPLRRRVVTLVDRKFNRSRYDAEKVISRFSERLRDEVDLERLAEDSLSVVDETVQPATAGIWLRS